MAAQSFTNDNANLTEDWSIIRATSRSIYRCCRWIKIFPHKPINLNHNSFKYLVASVLCFLLNAGITFFLHEVLNVAEEIAFASAIITIFLINFFLFRFFIFKGHLVPIFEQFFKYSSFALGFRLSEYLFFLFWHTYIGIDYKFVTVLTLIIFAIIKYFAYDFLFSRNPEKR